MPTKTSKSSATSDFVPLPTDPPIESVSLVAFLMHNNITTEDGLPLDFRDHRFMIDVYEEMYLLEKDIVGIKAAQVTFTTTATNAVLCIAKNKKIDIIYTLPTFDDIRVFSGGKVNRIIAQNPVYQSWVPNKDTMEQKVVGDNVIHFRGTHQPKAATMVSSDLNVHDEIDSSNQPVVEQYSTRLQHSKLRRTWWFSHPSVPDFGVDKKWQISDQRHWFIKCGACKKWQYMRWPESVDMVRKIFQCVYCSAEITDNMRRQGQWVRKYKDRNLIGYWIPLLICPWVPAKLIIEYYETKTAEYFYTKVLGLPYVGGGNKVVQQQIYQNITKKTNRHPADSRVVIGVDTGVDCRYVIGNAQGLFRFGQFGLDAEKQLGLLMDHWERAIMIIDQGGDILMARKLRKKYPGRVFLVHYVADHKTLQLVKWGKNDETGNVQVDRNRMIQLVVDEFTDKRIAIHCLESPDEWYEYWLHFSHIYRTVDTDERLQRNVYKWHRSDRDDWVHATVYCRVGLMRFAQKGHIVRNFPEPEPNSYFVLPGGTTSRNPLEKVIEAVEKAPPKGGIVGVDNDDDEWR